MNVNPYVYCDIAIGGLLTTVTASAIIIAICASILLVIVFSIIAISCCYCTPCIKSPCCLSLTKCTQSCIRGIDLHGWINPKRTVANGIATLLVTIVGLFGFLLLLSDFYDYNKPISLLRLSSGDSDYSDTYTQPTFIFVLDSPMSVILRHDETNTTIPPFRQTLCDMYQTDTFVQFQSTFGPSSNSDTQKFTLVSNQPSNSSSFSGTMFVVWPIQERKTWPLFGGNDDHTTELDPTQLKPKLKRVFPLFEYSFMSSKSVKLELAHLEYREGGNHIWLPRSIYSSPSVISTEKGSSHISSNEFSFSLSSPNQEAFVVQTNFRSTSEFLILLTSYVGGLATVLHWMRRIIGFKVFRGFVERPEKLMSNNKKTEEEDTPLIQSVL